MGEAAERTPVEELSGANLSAAVVTEVLELQYRQSVPWEAWDWPPAGRLVVVDDANDVVHWNPIGDWRPDRDIAAAWKVKDALESRGLGVTIIGPKGVSGGTFRDDDRTGVVVSIPRDRGGRTATRTVRASTAPEAICRAALRAVRSE